MKWFNKPVIHTLQDIETQAKQLDLKLRLGVTSGKEILTDFHKSERSIRKTLILMHSILSDCVELKLKMLINNTQKRIRDGYQEMITLRDLEDTHAKEQAKGSILRIWKNYVNTLEDRKVLNELLDKLAA